MTLCYADSEMSQLSYQKKENQVFFQGTCSNIDVTEWLICHQCFSQQSLWLNGKYL